MAAMSATGLPGFWPPIEPRVPNFVHINPPYSWIFDTDGAEELEKKILEEGPETVAAFIAEPVMGAGGVVPPPDDYFPRVRAICDKYDVLFIADEVITGFGRTGKWFGLEHWGVQPDIVSFAKIVTSGYLPLGGIIISDELHNTMLNAPIDKKYMHAYTYSGHATCCAVGLKNIEIIERDNLVERASMLGKRLLAGLQTLEDISCVGEVRGLGLMCAIEMTADKATKKPFEPGLNMGGRVVREGKLRGVIVRNRGDVIMMAPPYVTTEEQIDTIVSVVRESLIAATATVAR
jgi:putrescine aminotransferase